MILDDGGDLTALMHKDYKGVKVDNEYLKNEGLEFGKNCKPQEDPKENIMMLVALVSLHLALEQHWAYKNNRSHLLEIRRK